MKTSNPLLDNFIEAQSQTINNWMDIAKKTQDAIASGSIATEGQHIYKEWMDKQLQLINKHPQENGHGEQDKPESLFKHWYNQQMEALKKYTDFNQSLYNSFANFGKTGNDYTNSYSSMNRAWTSMYESWVSSMNSSFDVWVKGLSVSPQPNNFQPFIAPNELYNKIQEFWQPALNALKGGDFSPEAFKNFFNPDSYKKFSYHLFDNYFNTHQLKNIFSSSVKNIEDFFTSRNNLGREYYQQIQTIANEFPHFIGGDFARLSAFSKEINNVFGKTFEPLLKLVNQGKEKEKIEAHIALLDQLTRYYVKQAEIQQKFYQTSQKTIEEVAKTNFEKWSKANPKEITGFGDFYNEWLKVSETAFNELFSSDDFSKAKGELVNLGMDIKKQFEKQFESYMNVYPVVFRSEMEELHKTIYDLKKQIKQLETRLAVNATNGIEFEEDEKMSKAKKK